MPYISIFNRYPRDTRISMLIAAEILHQETTDLTEDLIDSLYPDLFGSMLPHLLLGKTAAVIRQNAHDATTTGSEARTNMRILQSIFNHHRGNPTYKELATKIQKLYLDTNLMDELYEYKAKILDTEYIHQLHHDDYETWEITAYGIHQILLGAATHNHVGGLDLTEALGIPNFRTLAMNDRANLLTQQEHLILTTPFGVAFALADEDETTPVARLARILSSASTSWVSE